MNDLKKNYRLTLKPVKIIVFLVLFAFCAILISFVYLNEYKSKKDYEDRVIVDLYDKQKMLVQEICKDSNMLYSFLLYDKLENQDDLRNHLYFLDTLKQNLKLSREAFSQILKATQSGYLRQDASKIDITDILSEEPAMIQDIYIVWSDFETAIQKIYDAQKLDDEVTEAVSFININNDILIEYIDRLQEFIINETDARTERMERLNRVLIGLFSSIAIASLCYLLKFIVLPFNALYKGLSDIGITEIPKRPDFPTKKKIAPIVDEINGIFQKLDDLISLIENINNNSSLTEILNFINNTFSKIIPYNYIGIALLSDDNSMLIASYGVSDGQVKGLPENLIGKSFSIDDTSLGDLIKTGKARIINDLEDYVKNKPIKPYNRVILNAGIRASITLPLKVSGEPVGIIFFSSINKNVYHEGHLNFLGTLADSIAISFYQNAYIDNIIYSSILALAKLAEARDTDTGEHLDRMKVYSRIIAQLLLENDLYTDEVNWEFIRNIERYSPLHDIGKVGISDSILLKKGKLNEEEYEEMKKHTYYGASVLKTAEQNISRKGHSLFGLGIEIAECHHEKWDGSGYPYGKKGLEIPLSARIVAIADVFDALTSRRPYKEPMSFDEAINIIAEGSGTHFDPYIVDVFLKNKNRIRKAYYTLMMHSSSIKDEIINL